MAVAGVGGSGSPGEHRDDARSSDSERPTDGPLSVTGSGERTSAWTEVRHRSETLLLPGPDFADGLTAGIGFPFESACDAAQTGELG
jgi:hypothetical protein